MNYKELVKYCSKITKIPIDKYSFLDNEINNISFESLFINSNLDYKELIKNSYFVDSFLSELMKYKNEQKEMI